ncbi:MULTISPECIES: RHS repeat domain-containing protein [unclassified Lentimonas]|uniref:RHS repeat domain-containing protein n=1 Tax=unclassified Lentimonas TaxID=2630993 RepID=UPI00132B3E98|nr:MULTISPECIES: RHS repeat-associated core domain-containing protein [unclassified Lentimonas]CAA6690077.1 Putative insecticidal toxin complex [Lentimonas sp. CC19]CAA6690975.1 Putative insecticidal toxin complex [Lentimonas sp. CC10]CAA7070689.1 Putative insecticidal toxin complex [Lentimonas sp. CC11]
MKRFINLSLLYSLLLALTAAMSYAGNDDPSTGGTGEDPEEQQDDDEFDDSEESSEEETGDGDGTLCSVVYQMNIGELQSDLGGQEVRLRIKRLNPTPLMFTPQTLFFDSPLASELFDVEEDASEIAIIQAQTYLDVANSDLSDAQQLLSDAQIELNHRETIKESERLAGGYSSAYVPALLGLPDVGDVIRIISVGEPFALGEYAVTSVDPFNFTFGLDADGGGSSNTGDPLLLSEPCVYGLISTSGESSIRNISIGGSFSGYVSMVNYGPYLTIASVPDTAELSYSKAYWRWKQAEGSYNDALVASQLAQATVDTSNTTLISTQAARDNTVQERITTGSYCTLPNANICGGINVLRPNGTGIDYRPVQGEKYWKPQGDKQHYKSRIIPREATVCARVDGRGREFQFDVAQKAIPVFKNQKGRKVRRDSPGARQEMIKKSGVMRQICTPQALSDIVVLDEHSYEVRLYRPSDMGDRNAEGLFEPTGVPFSKFKVENPTRDINQLNRVRITSQKGNRQKVQEWNYSEAAKAWSFSKDGGDIEAIKSVTNVAPKEEVYRWETTNKDSSNQPRLCGVRTEFVKEFAWGKVITKKVKDPEGANLVRTFDYYTDSSQAGKYGEVKTEVKPDGSWVTMDYDSEGRETIKIESWLDAEPGTPAAQAKATYFDYTPVEASDTPLEYDLRPRTETVKILDQITKKTFYAYFENASNEFVEIEEMAATSIAAYGDAANLRRTKTHYATTEDEDIAGRLKTEEHPDGRLDAYSYERLEDNTFITTVTHGVVEAPDGVANKTTREVTTLDPQGNETIKETYVYNGVTYELIETIEKDFNERGQITERRRNDRVLYSAIYQDGLRVSKTDEQGITITYTYDAHERIQTETKVGVSGQADIVTTYTYDGENHILEKSLSGGDLTLTESWIYDLAGRKTSYTNPNGYTTTYAYENDGRRVIQTNADTSVLITEKFRDQQFKSTSGSAVVDAYYAYAVNSDGTITVDKTVGRSDSPRVLSITKDMLSRVIESSRPGFDSGAFLQTYDYDDRGLLVRQTEAEKADTLLVYDDARQLLRSGLDLNANGVLDLTSTDRITEKEQVYYQDVAGDWWLSSKGSVYADENASTSTLVRETRVRLNGHDLNEASETIIFDTQRNETNVSALLDPSTASMTVTTDVPNSSLDAVEIYVNGLLQTRSTTSIALPTIFTYDDLARRKTVKAPRRTQASIIEYVSGQNLVESLTDAAANETNYTYHPQDSLGAGRVASTSDALNQVAYQSYNTLGRVIRTWGDTDYPVEFSFDEFGAQTQMITYRSGDESDLWTQSTWPALPPSGDTTIWVFDEATRLLTAKTDASGESVTYDYTTAGRMSVRYWARDDLSGNPLKTSYVYDSFTGERIAVDYADTTPDLGYTFDRMGRLETVSDATGTRSLDYTADLRLDHEMLDAAFYGSNSVLTRSYEDGNETNGLNRRYAGYDLTNSGGVSSASSATYGYDSYGRLNSVADANDTFTYGYLADSDLLESTASSVHTATYSYETNRDVKTVVDNVVSSLSVSKYTYSYDAIGRRLDRIQEGTAFAQDSFDAFDYNDRSEVTDSDRYLGTDTSDQSSPVVGDIFDYDYDPIGNRLSSSAASNTSYTTNELNQYTSITGQSIAPTHDADSNQTQSAAGWTYQWDAENRLIEAYSFTEDKKLEFVYDYMGRRVQKSVIVISSGVTISSERFLYVNWNVIATFEIQNSQVTLQNSYTWGLDLSKSMQGAGGVGGLLKSSTPQSPIETHYFTYDVNGNVSELLDASGAIAAHYEYDPFGNVTRSSGAYANVNPFRFSSKYLDAETGLYYYGYRYYDAQVGRWLNADPLGESGGVNLYAFVANEGINSFDLFGLVVCETDEFMDKLNQIDDDFERVRGEIGDAADIVEDTIEDLGRAGLEAIGLDPETSPIGNALQDGVDLAAAGASGVFEAASQAGNNAAEAVDKVGAHLIDAYENW